MDFNINPLEALLGGAVGGGFPPLLDIPPDADDETMVELAIALSLQDHELADGGNAVPSVNRGAAALEGLSRGMLRASGVLSNQELQSLQAIAQEPIAQSTENGQHPETGHYSDTTASAGGSDDEGSTNATDGSTLRTSPADQAGSVESESGGSGFESITGEQNVSGRSSAYEGENTNEGITNPRSDSASLVSVPQTENDAEPEGNNYLVFIKFLTLIYDHIF